MLSPDLADKRKAFGVPDGLDCQIDIQLRPVEVIGRWQFDVENFSNCYVAKPGEFAERQEQFFILQQEPETMLGDVGHFNGRNACAMRRECHFLPPEAHGAK